MASVDELLLSLRQNNLDLGATLSKQAQTLSVSTSKVAERQSTSKQQQAMRKANFETVRQDMDKWIPIVKINRERDHIDFTQKPDNQLRVNFFPTKTYNPIADKIEATLSKINLQSEKQLVNSEARVLEQMDPEEAKERLNQIYKQKHLAFYEEMRRKRVAKIKSKLYHRIKKRQKERQEMEKFKNMGEEEKQAELEKMVMKRAQERISLRHKTKSKHITDMMRFAKGDKNRIQESINDMNRLRREHLEKINEEAMKDVSEEYDEENFREQALDDLQEEIKLIENMQHNPQVTSATGLKFMDKAVVSKLDMEKKTAYKLMQKLVRAEDEEDIQLSQEEQDEQEEEDEQGSDEEGVADRKLKRKRDKDEEEQANQDEPLVRKRFLKDQVEVKKISEQKKKKGSLKDTLNKYLDNQRITEESTVAAEKKQEYSADVAQKSTADLLRNIDTERLRQKYETHRVENINLGAFMRENEDLFENLAAVQNREEFEKEKMAQYEGIDEQTHKKKEPKGWGSWTGPGIKEKVIDPKKELAMKLKRIEEIKKNRKDGSNANAIIRENRNKQFASEYMVQKLPYNYKSKEQYEYATSEPVGQEWNSMRDFKEKIQPKIKTKKGETIQPVQLPKKIQKLHNSH